jgi:hypothetical protein
MKKDDRRLLGINLLIGSLAFFLAVLFILTGCGGGPGGVVIIGGEVLLQDGSPLEGIEVTFFWPDPPNVNSDGTWVVLTDENGWYSDSHPNLWGDRDFTVTPNHPSYTFSPSSYHISEAYEDVLDLNFTAIPN